MRKLKLAVDELRVDTFATGAQHGLAGTVRGNQEIADEGVAGEDIAITAPPPKSWDTQCRTVCYTCYDPTCNSCHATQCWTGNAPECCA